MARKIFYLPGEPLPEFCFSKVLPDGRTKVLYEPTSPKHRLFHQSSLPKLIMEGRRGTGKSHTIRWDAHMRSMAYPGFKYLVLRRTMPELRKSHLLFIEQDMVDLGGVALGVRAGNPMCYYPKDEVLGKQSIGMFGHCETEADVLKYLSAQFDAIYFDEITTFEWDLFTRISTSCRVEEGSGLTAIVRGGTNPIGVSADETYHYFIARDVLPEEDEKYDPTDWGSLHIRMEDAAGTVDFGQYDKQFVGLSKAYQDAWLEGKWGVEGAYFNNVDAALIQELPTIAVGSESKPMLQWPWLNIYRVLDYGFHDPTVCAWIAALPNGHYVAFREGSWVRQTVQDIIPQIQQLSDEQRIITTIADPTLWKGEEEMGHCMAHIFEDAGFHMTKGVNDRTANGFATQEQLNTIMPDGLPKLLIYEPGCPTLVKTLRSMKQDKKHPGRIADSKVDHFPIALGYFCMQAPPATRIPTAEQVRPWMQKPTSRKSPLGSYAVRRRFGSVYEG